MGATLSGAAASDTVITAGQLLGRWLRMRGVDAVYGQPLPRLPVVEVGHPVVARLLAMAHRRVHGASAAVHEGEGQLCVRAPGDAGGADAVRVEDIHDLLEAVPAGPVSLRLELDLAAPAPDVVPPAPAPVQRWTEPDPEHVKRLASARTPVVLAGPGVIDDGAAPGLNTLAASASLGVLNTWGAKGVLDWRSRHHWATVGLQARDFDLGGLGASDLIVATGVDEREAPPERWRLGPVIAVPTASLGPLAEECWRPDAELAMPPLRAALAAVTQEGWAAASSPLPPTRATLHYGRGFGSGALVAADPGIAGYWVARTLATTEVGGVQVPGAPDAHGFAPACALVARLRHPWRPVLAVVDGPVGPAVQAVLDTAAELGVSVPIEMWDADGPVLTPDAHLDRLGRLAVADRPEPASVATDGRQLDRMIDVAGPIVAWRGVPQGSP